MQGVQLPDKFEKLKKHHTGPIYALKFNSNGQYCMSGSQDRGVCLYNPHKNMMINHYKNLHNYDVTALIIAKDNSKFVTGGGDKNLIITDVVTGKCIRRYSGHNGRINTVCFNDDYSLIVTGSYDTTVKFWDNRANSFHPVDVIKGFKDSVSKVSVNKTQIICSSMDGSVRFYDVRTGSFTADQFGEAVQAMAISNSYRAYVASTQDNLIHLVDRLTGKKVIEYQGHKVANFSIQCCFNQEDSYLFTGSADGKLYIYDIMKSAPTKIISTCEHPLSALDIHPKGGLIGAGHSGQIFHWKL